MAGLGHGGCAVAIAVAVVVLLALLLSSAWAWRGMAGLRWGTLALLPLLKLLLLLFVARGYDAEVVAVGLCSLRSSQSCARARLRDRVAWCTAWLGQGGRLLVWQGAAGERGVAHGWTILLQQQDGSCQVSRGTSSTVSAALFFLMFLLLLLRSLSALILFLARRAWTGWGCGAAWRGIGLPRPGFSLQGGSEVTHTL